VSDVRLYVSFDVVHDEDLYTQLIDESKSFGSGFSIVGRTGREPLTDARGEALRREIAAADQLIVICGEHTGEDPRVSFELGLAREEQTPHFLLWGRREAMCSKPSSAAPSEAMYGWTLETLHERIRFLTRREASEARAAELAAARGSR